VELAQRTLEDTLRDEFILHHQVDCKSALEFLNSGNKVDVVLTDYLLPDGSGMDLLKKIKRMATPPAVIFVTGQGDEQLAVDALKEGAADYIVKQSDYLHRLPIVITNAINLHNYEIERIAKSNMEARYQSLVEHIPAVVFLDDVDDLETTLYINPRIEDLTGFTVDEWLTDPNVWENNIYPADRNRVLELDQASHRSGTHFQIEYRFLRKDKKVVWIREDTTRIDSAEGIPLFWQGILIDITDEKANETALQRQLQELTILNGVTAAGVDADSEDEVVERIVTLSTTIFNEVCGVLLLNEEGTLLTPHPSYFGANVSNWQDGVPVTEGITGRSVLTESTINLGDVSIDPDYVVIANGINSELCVPIRVNRKIIGVINVESSQPNAFTESDEELLISIASGLGAAIENIRLFNEERRRTSELNVLFEISKSLNQSLEPGVVALDLLMIMDTLLGYEYSAIYLLDEPQKTLIPTAISPKALNHEIYVQTPEEFISEARAIGIGIMGWVAKNGKPFRSSDVSKEPMYFPVIKDIQSELCVPLIARNKTIGVINVESPNRNVFSQQDEDLLITIANSAAVALDNARLFEAEKSRRKEAEILREATTALNSHIEMDPLLDQILTSAMDIVPYDSASIFLRDKSDTMKIIAVGGSYNGKNLIGMAVPEKAKWVNAVISHKPIIVNDTRMDPEFEIWEGSENIRCWMGIPMTSQDVVIGFINFDSYETNSFTEEDATLAQIFANSAAVVLQNAIRVNTEREQLKREASLLELMRITTSTLEVDQVVDIILNKLIELIPSDAGTIQLLQGNNLVVTAAKGFKSNRKMVGRVFPLDTYPVNRIVAESKRPYIINNIEKDDLFLTVEGFTFTTSFLAIPLIYKDKLIGIATLDSRIENRFAPEDIQFAITIGNQAAIAMENARLYQEAIQASGRREALHKISQEIIRFNQEPEQIYRAIHESTKNLMPCDAFLISLINIKERSYEYVYAVEVDTRYDLGRSSTNEISLPKHVIDAGASIIIKDENEITKHGFSRIGSSPKIQSIVAAPLQVREKIIGIVAVQSYQPNAFGEEEKSLLEMLATHAATAIDNMELYTETQRRLLEFETINRVSKALRMTQSQREMFNVLLEESLSILKAEDGSVWIFDPVEGILKQRKAKGAADLLQAKKVRYTEGIVGYVFTSGQAYTSMDLIHDKKLNQLNKSGLRPGFGGIFIPIQSTAGILGVLAIHVETHRINSENIGILSTLAEIAGNAIHRADLFDQSMEQVRKLTTLRDIDSAINSSTDLRVTLSILADHAINHLKVDAVDILLYHPELQSLSFFCSAGFYSSTPPRTSIRTGEWLAGRVAINGKMVHIPDLQEVKDFEQARFIQQENFHAYIGVPVIVKGQIKGVFEVFNRSHLSINEDWQQFLLTLAGQAAIAIDNSQLFDNLQKSNDDLKRAYDITLEGWARALELRDRETEGHTRRVTDLTMKLAQHMGIRDDELENIYRGVLLHDIGKMGVPDHILRKTGSLSDSEVAEMRKHPQYAYDLLYPIQYLRPAIDIPYCHHEHWDGSGYPRGLKGESIPLAARIFSVVDIWDALLSNRPYRDAWPREKVISYIKDISGELLDPQIVDIFLGLIEGQKV